MTARSYRRLLLGTGTGVVLVQRLRGRGAIRLRLVIHAHLLVAGRALAQGPVLESGLPAFFDGLLVVGDGRVVLSNGEVRAAGYWGKAT